MLVLSCSFPQKGGPAKLRLLDPVVSIEAFYESDWYCTNYHSKQPALRKVFGGQNLLQSTSKVVGDYDISFPCKPENSNLFCLI